MQNDALVLRGAVFYVMPVPEQVRDKLAGIALHSSNRIAFWSYC